MNNELPSLLPCPFCGYAAKYRDPDGPHGGMVCCVSCGAQAFGPKWNRRALSAAMPQVDGEAISDAAVEAALAARYGPTFRPTLLGLEKNLIRRALAAALPHLSAPVTNRGPWTVGDDAGKPHPVYLQGDDIEHDVLLYVSGDFGDTEDCLAYAKRLAAQLNSAPLPPQGAAVGEVFTMEALTPGGELRHHVSLSCARPSGTKLYTTPQPAALNEHAGNSGQFAGVAAPVGNAYFRDGILARSRCIAPHLIPDGEYVIVPASTIAEQPAPSAGEQA